MLKFPARSGSSQAFEGAEYIEIALETNTKNCPEPASLYSAYTMNTSYANAKRPANAKQTTTKINKYNSLELHNPIVRDRHKGQVICYTFDLETRKKRRGVGKANG